MGEVVSKGDAVETIIGDIDTTLIRAALRGSTIQADAESRLRPTSALAHEVMDEIAGLGTTVATLRQTRNLRDDEADDFLGAIHDRLYNLLGRPGTNTDPIYELMWPGGIAAYAACSVEQQPLRMTLLARLLAKGIHPRIDAETGKQVAAEVRASADSLREAVNALAGPEVELTMMNSMLLVLARVGQVQLSRLKKHWKGAGMSESDIHTLIPDRPRPKAKPKTTGGTEADAHGSSAAPPGAGAGPDNGSAGDATTSGSGLGGTY